MRKNIPIILALAVLAFSVILLVQQGEKPQSITGFAATDVPQFIQNNLPADIDPMRYYTDPSYVPPIYNETQDPPEPAVAPEVAALAPQMFRPAATIPTAACFTASVLGAVAGDYIVLTSDVSPAAGADCVILDVADISFGCAGFTVNGSGVGNNGVTVGNSNITIGNCTIERFVGDNVVATIIGGVPDLFNLTNITSRLSSDDGVHIGFGSQGTITDSSFMNNTDKGVYFSDGAGSVYIRNITAANNTDDELVIDSNAGDNFTIVNSSFEHPSGTTAFMIEFESNDEIYIINNTFGNFGATSGEIIDAGTAFTPSENVTIANNDFNDETGIFNAIDLANFTNVFIENNTISDGDISVLGRSNVQVRNNSLNDTIFVRGITFPSTINVTNVVIENNSWIEDTDNATNTNFAQSGFVAINYTVRNHPNVSMIFSCATCQDAYYTNNTLYGNAVIRLAGINATAESNQLPAVSKFGTTSGGIYYLQIPSTMSGTIRNNTLANGAMNSIEVRGSNVNVTENRIENVTGRGIVILGTNNSVRNNTISNFTGVAISINSTNNSATNNSIQLVVAALNTTLNLANATTPPAQTGGVGVLLDGVLTLANVSSNIISVSNPSALENGAFGIISTFGFGQNISTVANMTASVIENNTITGARVGIWMLSGTNNSMLNNSIQNSNQSGIIVESGSENYVNLNTISAATPSLSPGLFERGIFVYRTSNNTFAFNSVTGYNTGLFLNNATGNFILNFTASGNVGYGVYSFQSVSNNLSNITATGLPIGISFMQSNSSLINDSAISGGTIGIEFYQSFSNTIGNTTQAGGGTANYGLVLDLFSASNTVNNNVFGGNVIADILFDMFATLNTGAGNGGPSTVSENGAAGNAIT